MEFKIEGTLNLADVNQVNAAIAFLSALHANPATETGVKNLTVVDAEVVAPAEKPATKKPATKKQAVKEEAPAEAETPAVKEEAPAEAETPAAKEEAPAEAETPAAKEEAPAEAETPAAEAQAQNFTKDDCREVLGAINLAGHKDAIKTLLTSRFNVTSITSLPDTSIDDCYKALKDLAQEHNVKLD